MQDLITELKHTEKEKVNYMTYQMKIAEERAEAMAEGEARGEGFYYSARDTSIRHSAGMNCA